MRSFPVLILSAACLVSCAEETALPVFGEPVWDGEHLQVWATEDARICGGSLQALDHHAQQVSDHVAQLGVRSTPERYRYYWISDEENESHDPCPKFGRACFLGITIYATHYSSHEVVHSEFASKHSSFVDEGLAVMLGDFDTSETLDTTAIPDIIDETQGESLPNEYYRPAGKFIGAMRELYPEEYLAPLLQTQGKRIKN